MGTFVSPGDEAMALEIAADDKTLDVKVEDRLVDGNWYIATKKDAYKFKRTASQLIHAAWADFLLSREGV